MTTHLPARKAARHCAELLGAAPSIDELVPALSLLGERLARAMPAHLARVTGGEPPLVSTGMPMDGTLGTIQSELETLAAHSLLTLGAKALPMLATFEASPVFRLVDRAFGGRGDVPDPLPDSFPLSAELLLGHVEQAICAALTEVFGIAHQAAALRRDTSLRQLDPFDKRTELLMLSFEVQEAGFAPWSLSLAFPQATLAPLVEAPRRPLRLAATRPAPDPAREPFASLPVEIAAVLIDMPIGMKRLSALRPGDVLPVAVARAVPLEIGGNVIATGTIGELDDRVAIQIGSAFGAPS